MDKLDILTKLIENNQESTNTRLESIDKNLGEHMEQTRIVRGMAQDNRKSIVELERPREFLKSIKTVSLYLSAFAGAVLVVMKVIEQFK